MTQKVNTFSLECNGLGTDKYLLVPGVLTDCSPVKATIGRLAAQVAYPLGEQQECGPLLQLKRDTTEARVDALLLANPNCVAGILANVFGEYGHAVARIIPMGEHVSEQPVLALVEQLAS